MTRAAPSLLPSLLLSLLLCLLLCSAPARAAAAEKVLRYAFQIAETGFDPAQISDNYSRIVTAHIFEALYGYDPLALPVRIVPLTAQAMPEASSDFRTFTIRLRPGIFFADDPAFKGKPRELVAEDYVFSFKRFADPAVKSPMWGALEEQGILGLAELRAQAGSGRPFSYDQPIAGLRALDRHTLQIRTAEPRPRLVEILAQNDLFGAVAREVAEAYAGDFAAHPVGTGPFRLDQWRRSSLITLKRNAAYRERYFESQASDPEGRALAAPLQGRRIPMIDRVEISIIEESQPRWLSFLNGEHNFVDRMPNEFVAQALPGGKIAPNLAKRGFKLYRTLAAEASFIYFNMEDPVVGGFEPEKVALRRAFSLGWDVPREIRLLRRGEAIVAQGMVLPHTSGYDPAYKSEMGDYDPARANALLDLYGYLDRDGDGWRDRPDGSPLVLEWGTQPDSLSRAYDELFRINMEKLRIRTSFNTAKWPEQLKSARAGKLQLWFVGTSAAQPDGIGALQRMYSPQSGKQNLARFKLPAFDAIYEKLQVLPDGPEREALFLEAKRIQAALMPMKTNVHRIVSDMSTAELVGYRRPMFRFEWWQYVDLK